MEPKLQLLVDKIEELLSVFDRLKRENVSLKAENMELKTELAKLRKEYHQIELGHTDQSEAIKAKLTSVLGRLEELESLHL
jgi:FtsZ-binding cell division protein ZapB